jgi:putative MATE family efflux protein
MILGNILQNAAAAFVLFLMGRIGVEALAAYSIVMTSVMALFYSVHGALINAAIAFVSRKAGAGRMDVVNKALPGMLGFGTLLFLAYGAIVVLTAGPVLSFFGAKGEVLGMAREYAFLAMISCFFMTFYSLLLGVSRGAGDSVTPLKVVLVMSVSNIILNGVLTLWFGMGLRGAAISETAGYFVGAVVYSLIFVRGLHGIKLGKFTWDKNEVLSYAKLTMKSLVQNFSIDIGVLAMLRIVAGYGYAFIAAYGIVQRLLGFLLMIGWPITNSGGVIVGQNLGKKMIQRAMDTIKSSYHVFLWAAVPATLACVFIPSWLMSRFTDNADVISFGRDFLLILSPAIVFLAMGLASQAGLSGAGFITVPTVANIIILVFLRLFLAATLPGFAHFNGNGVFLSVSLTVVLYGIVNWYMYRQGNWTKKEI